MKLTSLLNAFKLITFDKGVAISRYVPTFFGGGGGNTTSTSVTTNIPDWLKPETQQMLAGATKQLFQVNDKGEITGTNAYVPYSTNVQDYYAGFSPMQQQSFAQAANLQVPGQYQGASDFANAAGMGGLGSARQAYGYGNAGFQSGQLGQQIGLQALQAQRYGMGIGNKAQNYAAQAAAAGKNYGNLVTNPYAVQSYMSPYQQNVTDVQKAAALREFQTGQQMRQANAARSGAYGGARQAIENAEAQRNLNSQLQAIEATGQQNAYNQALANIAQQQNFGLQGLSGAQQGLGTALQGGQLGLSGIGQALAGTQQGISGAGMGLQGVQGAQAGYGLANQVGQNLTNIGTQQLAAQKDIIGLQNQMGAQQQAQQQKYIDAAIANYANAQNAPMNAFNQLNALIRGMGGTTTNYAPAPSLMSQVGGLGAAGLGAYMASRKEGGVIKAYKSGGLVDLAIENAMGNA